MRMAPVVAIFIATVTSGNLPEVLGGCPEYFVLACAFLLRPSVLLLHEALEVVGLQPADTALHSNLGTT